MAIQNNQIRRYIELLPAACVWFSSFNASNYANACQVFALQWAEWLSVDHPVLEFLDQHFKATSEEYGESAIHMLMTHIREWNYTGPNMKKRWLESSVASDCFDFFQIPVTHRASCTKWYSEDGCGQLMTQVCQEFLHVCNEVAEGDYSPLVRLDGYRNLDQVSDDMRPWNHFVAAREGIGLIVSRRCLKIRLKLRKPLQAQALAQIDPDLFF